MTQHEISAPELECALSADCARVLNLWDLYAEPTKLDTVVSVRDSEGHQLFLVSPSISSMNLSTILNYGNQQRKRGIAEGERAARSKMLSALGLREVAA